MQEKPAARLLGVSLMSRIQSSNRGAGQAMPAQVSLAAKQCLSATTFPQGISSVSSPLRITSPSRSTS